jgi:glycosyltransferase involved in cell wall biosynthesis
MNDIVKHPQSAGGLGPPRPLPRKFTVNVTVPVLNEESCLARNIHTLSRFTATLPFDCQIVIADNGSVDGTEAVGRDLARDLPEVSYLRLPERGRGRALKAIWQQSEADFLSYMDVDLSTDLDGFPRLISALSGGLCDLAIGSRLLRPEWTRRGWKREVISRCYNRLIKLIVGARFSDAQCGFKAIKRSCARELLPRVQDNHWFFDTELLVLAEALGYRIYDLPVRWSDDPDSRVRIIRTAIDDLRGLIRLRRELRRRSFQRVSSAP